MSWGDVLRIVVIGIAYIPIIALIAGCISASYFEAKERYLTGRWKGDDYENRNNT